MTRKKTSYLDWLNFTGPAETDGELSTHLSELDGRTLSDKLRRVYTWILNNAILTPSYDLAFGAQQGKQYTFPNGDSLCLPAQSSFSSYILLPLLSLATRRKCLLVGGPGRGKTAIATLMGLVAGVDGAVLRRAVQHGHPQLTVGDLLGSPLPADLMRAEDLEQIKVSWKRWLELPVKIVDEYNRIPTKTQSALLSLMAEALDESDDRMSEGALWRRIQRPEYGLGMGMPDFKEALDELIHKTSILREDRRSEYSFNIDLLRHWIRKKHPVRSLYAAQQAGQDSATHAEETERHESTDQ